LLGAAEVMPAVSLRVCLMIECDALNWFEAF
jgi:hypothetical protein